MRDDESTLRRLEDVAAPPNGRLQSAKAVFVNFQPRFPTAGAEPTDHPGCGRAVAWDAAHRRAAESAQAARRRTLCSCCSELIRPCNAARSHPAVIATGSRLPSLSSSVPIRNADVTYLAHFSL
ncbi:hypothetical protein [Longimicrobium sp.]|uniref:hypothetical protein n=1 Tax=Longimicrobium sp. TaxID=2029185 RepID=UPI003B3A7F3E